jgi:AcrR family transcriptional regulator
MVRTLNSEKREKLLSAALRLFVAQGVQNTTTADISKQAGTAAGTLFLYFPTKQDLLDALILNIGQEQSDTIHALLETTFSARETFWTIWTGTITWFIDHMDAYVYVQQVRDTGMISESVVQETNKFFGYYYAAVQKGRAEGSIQPYPLELIGGELYQQIVAVMTLIRTQPDATLHEQYIRQGFDIFWDGIKTQPSASGGSHHAL